MTNIVPTKLGGTGKGDFRGGALGILHSKDWSDETVKILELYEEIHDEAGKALEKMGFEI